MSLACRTVSRVTLCALALIAVSTCDAEDPPPPSLLDPTLTERELRDALGVPAHAERVLILSQSSHLDIDWRRTFDAYYDDLVEGILVEAIAGLDADPDAFYSIAEMAFLAAHLERHDPAAWRRHAGTGHARVVGGGLTTPDTLLPTDEALIRDYLLGTVFAEEQLGARPRAAWLPDSFGHSPTAPDLLSAAGFTSVGFGRADGARHTYEVVVGGLPPIVPGVVTTASMLRDLGSADFVWRGPGGGEVLAHYMPVREYCQGDTIDLDGFVVNGARLGVDHTGDRGFVVDQIAGYVAELTPYQRTPYLFVPVGCDFQPPRPGLAAYARWWNQERFAATGVWVATATFEDYMRLVWFHRDALPVLERDITPVWTGFYASRPRIKRLARAAAEALAGVEPFLALVDPGADAVAAAWRPVALANHHDWITGTSTDAVVADEQRPLLEAALATAEAAWRDALAALAARIDTTSAGPGEVVVVVNPGPVDRSAVVEVASGQVGAVRARAGAAVLPAQVASPGRVGFLAADVPAFGWRTFTLEAGEATGATAVIEADAVTIATGALDARFTRAGDGWALSSLLAGGDELLAGASLEWVVYQDTGGLYRIGSERPDCAGSGFAEVAAVRLATLEVIEPGPARVTLRGTALVDGHAMVVEVVAVAGADRLTLRVTGAAARDRTIALRVRPRDPDAGLTMGVAAGVVDRPLTHHYAPSWWPAVTWVARGALAVHLAQATGVRGTADGALEWIVLRNVTTELPCDDVGPSGTDDGELTVEVSLGRRAAGSTGAAELAASIELARPMHAITTDRHTGALAAADRLIAIDGPDAVATALKPASRGGGLVLHLARFGAGATRVELRRGALAWDTVTRPDLLERDDVRFGDATAGGVTLTLDAALTAIRLTSSTGR